MKLLFLCWAFFVCAAQSRAAIINAASASRADVNTAIGLASAGDTVVVPPGTESWSGGVTVSGITLQGPGKDAGSPCTITAGLLTITKHATSNTTVSGFRWTGTGQHWAVGGTPSNAPFIIHDCYIFNDGNEWANWTTNGGLVHGCEFESTPENYNDTSRINLGGPGGNGLASWQAATTMGEDDTTGLVNTYFENNVASYFSEVLLDFDNGARCVVRSNVFYDIAFVTHGGGSGSSGQDTSSYGGRHVEFYWNDFIRQDGEVSLNKWQWQRGSTMVWAYNSMDDSSSSSYPNKDNIRLSVGCPGDPGHPMAYQVGQTTQTPDSTPDQPILIFGNTGAGAGDITISGSSGGGITCGTPSNYIQEGRDYDTSNSWGWVPYEYPHPLASVGEGGPSGTVRTHRGNQFQRGSVQ